jgi:hypothetical protein
MVFLLTLLATTVPPTPATKVEIRSKATVKVVRGQAISSRTWYPDSYQSQREVIKKDESGNRALIRLTEFE